MLPRLLLTNMRDFSLATKKNIAPMVSAFVEQALIAGIGYSATTGKLGMPRYGAAGFGYASSFVSIFSLVIYSVYLALDRNDKKNPFFKLSDYHKFLTNLKKLIRLGLPIGLRIFSERAAVTFATIMAGWHGKDALSVQEIALQYMMFTIVPFYGVGRGMGIVVKRYQDNKSDIRKLATVGIAVASTVSLSALIVYETFRKSLITMFLNDSMLDKEEILEKAEKLLLIVSLTEIFDCSRSVLEGGLRGIEKSGYTMIANLATIWCIGAPMSYLLGFESPLELSGIFIGRGLGIALGCGLLLYKWVKETSENLLLDSEEKSSYCPIRFPSFSSLFSFRRNANSSDEKVSQYGTMLRTV